METTTASISSFSVISNVSTAVNSQSASSMIITPKSLPEVGFTVTSDDPSIATATTTDDNKLVVTGVSVGSTKITVYASTPGSSVRVASSTQVTVTKEVDSTEESGDSSTAVATDVKAVIADIDAQLVTLKDLVEDEFDTAKFIVSLANTVKTTSVDVTGNDLVDEVISVISGVYTWISSSSNSSQVTDALSSLIKDINTLFDQTSIALGDINIVAKADLGDVISSLENHVTEFNEAVKTKVNSLISDIKSFKF